MCIMMSGSTRAWDQEGAQGAQAHVPRGSKHQVACALYVAVKPTKNATGGNSKEQLVWWLFA